MAELFIARLEALAMRASLSLGWLSSILIALLVSSSGVADAPTELGHFVVRSDQARTIPGKSSDRKFLVVSGRVLRGTVLASYIEGTLQLNGVMALPTAERVSLEPETLDARRAAILEKADRNIPYMAAARARGEDPSQARARYAKKVEDQVETVRNALSNPTLHGSSRSAVALSKLDPTLVETSPSSAHAPRINEECGSFRLFFHGTGWVGVPCRDSLGIQSIPRTAPDRSELSLSEAKKQLATIKHYLTAPGTGVVILSSSGAIFALNNAQATALADDIEIVLNSRSALTQEQRLSRFGLPMHVQREILARLSHD